MNCRRWSSGDCITAPGSTSVVVVTKDRPQVLADLLESLERQSVPPDEIVVVDNNSTASYAEVFRKYRDRLPLKTAVERTPGIAAARRRAPRPWSTARDRRAPGSG